MERLGRLLGEKHWLGALALLPAVCANSFWFAGLAVLHLQS